MAQQRPDPGRESSRLDRRPLILTVVHVVVAGASIVTTSGSCVSTSRGCRFGLRQVDLDTLGQQWRGNHEDHEEHQHDVDVGDDVDLRHRSPAYPVPGPHCSPPPGCGRAVARRWEMRAIHGRVPGPGSTGAPSFRSTNAQQAGCQTAFIDGPGAAEWSRTRRRTRRIGCAAARRRARSGCRR